MPGAADTANVVIGKTAEADREFLGMIDDVRIYNHGLTEAEIQESMEDVPFAKALAIDPAIGMTIEETDYTLRWKGGDFATSHKVYFGESREAVAAGQVEPVSTTEESLDISQIPAYAAGLTSGRTYYWRVDGVDDLHPDSPWQGDVWSFRVRPLTAWNPSPADGVKYVRVDQELTWEEGLGAFFHTIFIGTTFEEVENAVIPSWMTGDPVYQPTDLESVI